MTKVARYFIELMQVALGRAESLSGMPTEKQWYGLLQMSVDHSMQGIIFAGIQRLSQDQMPPLRVKMLFHGQSEAVRLRYIASNPAAGVILPKGQKADIRPFEVDDIQRFNAAITDMPGQDLFWFLLNTGCRLSEVLGLRWSRVNFQRRTITIDAQMVISRKGQGRALGTPKNGKSRTFKAAPVVMDCLKAVQRRQMEWKVKAGPAWTNDLDLVFTNDSGEGLPHNTVENWFRKATRRAGVEGHRLHDLRHTFATEAIRAGVDVKSISETLGHSSVAFTLDVYAGFTEAMQDEAAARIQALILDRDSK